MNSAILKIKRTLDHMNVVHATRKFIVLYMGNPIKLRSGKNIWSGRNHAAAAVTNFINTFISYQEMKNCGYESFGEITKELIKEGIIEIREIKFENI